MKGSPRLVVWVVRKNNAAKPSSTKVPVPRFNVRFLPISMLLQKRCCDQIVQEQYYDRRRDDGVGRGPSDTLGGRRRVVSLIYRDQAAGDPEHQAFHDALVDV